MRPHVRPALTTAVVALAVALLATSCGGSSASSSSSTVATAPAASSSPVTSPSAAGPNPCEILTNDEIAAVTGSDPGAAALDSELTSCTYSGGLAVSVLATDPAVNAEALMNSAGASGVLPLDGVGDNAAYAEYAEQGVVLLIAQQDGMQIGIYDTVSVDTASTLAQAMLDALTS